MEAADEGRDLAALHGLSFTLPAGLLTPLTGGKLRLLKVAPRPSLGSLCFSKWLLLKQSKPQRDTIEGTFSQVEGGPGVERNNKLQCLGCGCKFYVSTLKGQAAGDLCPAIKSRDSNHFLSAKDLPAHSARAKGPFNEPLLLVASIIILSSAVISGTDVHG